MTKVLVGVLGTLAEGVCDVMAEQLAELASVDILKHEGSFHCRRKDK